ncbi:hypothetical protein FB446DRAFT_763079 [Lentinula raphanica]|nr:hypothetical protein FB446DRAFT_763079 [Lentinula raphanica]
MELPDEIMTQIFDLAADEDVIFQYGLPTVMAESAWFKNAMDEWALRSPQEAINSIQRRSYATKKAIMLTCKTWRRLGSDILYRCLFFDKFSRLRLLCDILDADAEAKNKQGAGRQSSVGLGWWTKRLHLSRYFASTNPDKTQEEEMCTALSSIVRHCPNLSIFVVEWPMPSSTFGLVADSLFKYTRQALHTVHWHVSAEAIPKVIWALDSLPFVLVAHIEFSSPGQTTELAESLHLGSAQDIVLDLPYLQQLTLRGSFSEFLEQAVDWNLKGLRVLSLDYYGRSDAPDIVGFLERHGERLKDLDINSTSSLDVPDILELCPRLEVFSFNADWRFKTPTLLDTATEGIPIADSEGTSDSAGSRQRRRQSNTMRLSLGSYYNETSILTTTPHPSIHTIGLHGLLHAFGVGFSEDTFRSRFICRANDLNFGALNKAQFPHLGRIRVLSRTLLNALNRNDGPGEVAEDEGEDANERYERWWERCGRAGVRLEDCTGGEFGVLPADDDDEDGDEDEDEEDGEEDYDSDDWEIEVPNDEENLGGSHTQELRQLIRECRAMEEERDESPFEGFYHCGWGTVLKRDELMTMTDCKKFRNSALSVRSPSFVQSP